MAHQQKCSAYDAIPPLLASDRIGTAAKRNLRRFEEMMQSFSQMAATASVRELAEQILNDTHYLLWLQRQDNSEADARLDNLGELLGSIAEYEEDCAVAGDDPNLDDYLTLRMGCRLLSSQRLYRCPRLAEPLDHIIS